MCYHKVMLLSCCESESDTNFVRGEVAFNYMHKNEDDGDDDVVVVGR